jgi:hypothetical protein
MPYPITPNANIRLKANTKLITDTASWRGAVGALPPLMEKFERRVRNSVIRGDNIFALWFSYFKIFA